MSKKYKVRISKIVLLLTANYFGAFAWGLFAPLFALIVLDRGGSVADVGILWGGYTLLGGSSMIIFGRIEDKKHLVKELLVIGSILQTIASVALLIFNQTEGLIAAQFIFGIGSGMVAPAIRAAYGSLLKRSGTASGWGFMDGGNMLIMSTSALIGGFTYEYASPRALYLLMSAAFGLSSLLLFFSIKTLRRVL